MLTNVNTPDANVFDTEYIPAECFARPLVTDLETCCWKIPRTADALETTGLPEAARLALLRAEPGQVLGSADTEEQA